MRFLRTNTACRVTVGPFFDKTDGVTPETAQTVTSMKLTFMVDDANVPTLVLDAAPTASAGNNDMVHVTGDDAGFYDLELTASNLNYLGRAMLAITDATVHCPVFHEFMIIPAMIYDSMILGTDRLDTNSTHINDQALTASGGITFPAATLASTTNITAGTITTVTTVTTATNVTTVKGLAAGVITASSIASDAITDAKVASDVTIASVTGAVGSVTGNVGGNVAGTVASVVGAVGSVTGNVGGNVTGTVGGFTTAAKAEIEAEVNDALVVQKLDHLVAVADADDVADNSIIAKLASKNATADWSTYVNTTDSLEGSQDNVGVAGAGLTAADDAVISAIAALNNITAASVWAVGTRTLTAGTNIVLAKGVGVTGFNDIAATDIVSAGAITTSSGGVVLTTADKNTVADTILARNVSNVEASMPEHCLGTAILGSLEFVISGSVLTIYRTNGSTTHATKTITTNSPAVNVSGIS